MTWVKLDDSMPDHPKIVGLSAGTKWALIELWCYAAKHKTDGHVPDGATPKRANRKQLDELATSELIHRNGNGWVIHDWMDHNVSKSDYEARRASDAERLRKWREKRDGNDD